MKELYCIISAKISKNYSNKSFFLALKTDVFSMLVDHNKQNECDLCRSRITLLDIYSPLTALIFRCCDELLEVVRKRLEQCTGEKGGCKARQC